MDDLRWLTTAQAAKLLHVHPDTLRKRAASGSLPGVRIETTPGRHRKYLASDIEALAQRGWGAAPAVAGPPDASAPATFDVRQACPVCGGRRAEACRFCVGAGQVAFEQEVRAYTPLYFGRWDHRDLGRVMFTLLACMAPLLLAPTAVHATVGADSALYAAAKAAALVGMAVIMLGNFTVALQFMTGGGGRRPNESGRWEIRLQRGIDGREYVSSWRRPLGEPALDSRGRTSRQKDAHAWQPEASRPVGQSGGDDGILLAAGLLVASGGDFDFSN